MLTVSQRRLANLIIITATLLLCGTLLSETYYVSPSGSDLDSGSIESPWLNLNYAVMVATAGDTIFMRDGVYETDEVWIRSDRGMGGADGQYLTIKAYPGERPSVGGLRRVIIRADYVRVEGIHFRLPYNITCAGEGLQLLDNTFEGPQPRYGVIQFSSNNGLVAGNEIRVSEGGDTRDHGIYLYSGRNNIVRNNIISNTSGYGLHVYDEGPFAGYDSVLIEGNLINNSRLRSGIVISPDYGLTAQSIIVRRNIITNNVTNGIRLRGDTQDVEIYNNTIYGNGWGADNEDDGSAISIRDAQVRNISLTNNIIEMTRDDAFHIQNREGSVDVIAEHNLYCGSAMRLKDVEASDGIDDDPWLVDPANDDFHLASLSPAIDAGADMGLPFLGDAPDLGAIEFGLSGLAHSPVSHDFGKVEVGYSLTTTIQISNSGPGDLDVRNIDIVCGKSAEFQVESGGEPFVLPVGAYHDFTVRFKPANTGFRKASLRLKFDNALQDTSLCISLLGYGDPGDVPNMVLQQNEHDFGEIELGLTAATTVQATNTGALDLVITRASIAGPDSMQFWADGDSLPVTIAPGTSHDFSVRFNPDSLGSKNATLLLESNDWDDPVVAVALTGMAIAVREPDISMAISSYDYGSVDVGAKISYALQINNAGTRDLECYAIHLIGTDSTEFSYLQGSAPFSLTPGETEELMITFHPTSSGAKSAALRLESNDPVDGRLDILLIGQGVSVTGVESNSGRLPKAFSLRQNYPNPFNPETSIQYELPTAAQVRIRIFDLTGKELRVLVDQQMSAGIHFAAWNGRNASGRDVASGTYLYRVVATASEGQKVLFDRTKRMVLLR